MRMQFLIILPIVILLKLQHGLIRRIARHRARH
jgi:hypothetical protein